MVCSEKILADLESAQELGTVVRVGGVSRLVIRQKLELRAATGTIPRRPQRNAFICARSTYIPDPEIKCFGCHCMLPVVLDDC